MKTLYERLVESIPDMNSTDTKRSDRKAKMKAKIVKIVNDLMSKYNLTDKDLFSFCICAVNFLTYHDEEDMSNTMWNCPERYAYAESDNLRAVAGALNGEKKAEGWTDEVQFFHYMKELQRTVEGDASNMSVFLNEYTRFEKVYRREIFIPIMLGCPVEDYDDSRFYDKKYIKSTVNVNNLTLSAIAEKERWLI